MALAPTWPSTGRPAFYQPRQPRNSVLYQLIETYYEDVKALWEEDAKRAAAFAAFLKDELLENVGHCLWTSQFLLFLADIGTGAGFIGVNGEAVWRTEFLEGEERQLRHRMGIRFVELSESTEARLDNFVVETLENQLLSRDLRTLDPDFVQREQLVL